MRVIKKRNKKKGWRREKVDLIGPIPGQAAGDQRYGSWKIAEQKKDSKKGKIRGFVKSNGRGRASGKKALGKKKASEVEEEILNWKGGRLFGG